MLQQVEHGALSIVAGYRSLGRLYRGIIETTLKQYTHLGDAATQTDNVVSDDDRWVFTEENPRRQLGAAAALAASARVLVALNPKLAAECEQIAVTLFAADDSGFSSAWFGAAVELLQATADPAYAEAIVAHVDDITADVHRSGWLAARSLELIYHAEYRRTIKSALQGLSRSIAELSTKTPYGVPYEPDIWGAGWGIQRFGFEQYWLHMADPEAFSIDQMVNALNFVLGCHPGSNTTSFVSGVGAKSLIPGYGVNRAEFSYIPGGIGSGTALIRPDYPELLEWPYLWQQTEYCVGQPTADYVFLVAAADAVLNRDAIA